MFFELTVEHTYRTKGFFNVTVEWDDQVRGSNGPVTLVLGNSGLRIEGRIDRKANLNKTPRVFGNTSERRAYFGASTRDSQDRGSTTTSPPSSTSIAGP